ETQGRNVRARGWLRAARRLPSLARPFVLEKMRRRACRCREHQRRGEYHATSEHHVNSPEANAEHSSSLSSLCVSGIPSIVRGNLAGIDLTLRFPCGQDGRGSFGERLCARHARTHIPAIDERGRENAVRDRATRALLMRNSVTRGRRLISSPIPSPSLLACRSNR